MSGWNDFPRTLQVLEDGSRQSLHRGVQIYVSQNGTPIIDLAWGEDRDSEALTTQHVMLWLSSGKPLTAAALGVLSDRGLLNWEDTLALYIPEWAMLGQPDVTLKNLLTHTAGFQNHELNWPEASWSEVISEIVHRPLPDDWPAGEKAGYAVSASWFLLGEVIARLTSLPFSEALYHLVLEPLGMLSTFCGLSDSRYEQLAPRLTRTYGRSAHGLIDLEWHQRSRVIAAAPGGNCRGPVRELGTFYESLLGVSDAMILKPTTVDTIVSRQREGIYDETFRHTIDWGLGVIVNSNRYGVETVPYGFGRYAGESTFGHGGSQSSIGFADPENQLVVAWVANGRVGEPRHHARNQRLNEAIYQDLGLTRDGI